MVEKNYSNIFFVAFSCGNSSFSSGNQREGYEVNLFSKQSGWVASCFWKIFEPNQSSRLVAIFLVAIKRYTVLNETYQVLQPADFSETMAFRENSKQRMGPIFLLDT